METPIKMKPHSERSSETKTWKSVERALTALFELRNIKVTPDALRLWLSAFSDLTPTQICDAVVRFTRESSEYPTPHGVRKFAVGTNLQRGTISWNSVRRCIVLHGGYRSIDFDDSITNAVINAMGGWVRICDTNSDQMQWLEKEFIRQYDAISLTGIGDATHVRGIIELGNTDKTKNQPVLNIEVGLPETPTSKRLCESKPTQRKQNRIIANMADGFDIELTDREQLGRDMTIWNAAVVDRLTPEKIAKELSVTEEEIKQSVVRHQKRLDGSQAG